MDVSDGLMSDLPKMCAMSGVEARVSIGKLPVSGDVKELFGPEAMTLALTAGEDYELLVAGSRGALERASKADCHALDDNRGDGGGTGGRGDATRRRRYRGRVSQIRMGAFFEALTHSSRMEIVTRGPEETQALGRRIGELMEGGELVLMVGDLGAGKTCLTQGIAWGLGVNEYARSPTFVLVSEYEGRPHSFPRGPLSSRRSVGD